ncbi:unnamed protein product [Diatraea saccharalis]|nr:unnamed protein product [Diatraea saccharalis]
MVLVGATGIFLNSVVLIVLIKNRWLWNASNYLIGNLAFVDLITLIFCPWFMLVRDFYQNYVLQRFGCQFEGFMQATLLLASVGAIMLVSYDRLSVAALTPDAKITKTYVPRLIGATWFVSIALSLPWIIKREYMERQWKNHLEKFCVEDPHVLGIYWHFTLSLLVWIPLGLMVVTYGTIMWKLEWSARKLSARGGGRAVVKAKRKTMRIAALVLLVAVICRIPYTILVFWRDRLSLEINSVQGGYDIMWFAANYLIYMDCAINPLIYGFTNFRFRKAMDRTPGIALFKFGSWCCVCSMFKRNPELPIDNASEKIFVIETTPRPNKKLVHVIKNILHIKKDTLEVSVKVDEVTKPTKMTPVKMDN